jgi:glutamate/tyrosine decarboxylase-like PLP-dependent enzyme
MYMTFRHIGVKGLGLYIDKTFETAEFAADLIRESPDFELGTNPDTNVLLFRYNPGGMTRQQLEIEPDPDFVASAREAFRSESIQQTLHDLSEHYNPKRTYAHAKKVS